MQRIFILLIASTVVAPVTAPAAYIYHYQRCQDILRACEKKYVEQTCNKIYTHAELSSYWGKTRCYASGSD